MQNTGGEKVEVLVGVVAREEFHGKRLRFSAKEVDAYETGESRHVLYERGHGRCRILVSRFDGGSEIHPEPEAEEAGGLSYRFLPRSGRRDGRARSPSPASFPSKT